MKIKIQSKGDVESTESVVRMGDEAVQDNFDNLVRRAADLHWPVSRILIPFLASLGNAIAPDLKRVLDGSDLDLKYLCITNLVARLPEEAARQIEPELVRIADSPTPEEKREELNVDALAAMEDRDWRPCT